VLLGRLFTRPQLPDRSVHWPQLHSRATEAQAATQAAFKMIAKYIPAEKLWMMDEAGVVRLGDSCRVSLPWQD
jgi:hypothetical protein